MACVPTIQTFLSLCLMSIFLSTTGSAKEIEISARGYCGDGILNGNEECDGNDMNFTDCSVLQGGEGRLGCQDNCIYDISECESRVNESVLVTEINRRIGGLAESCKCQCNTEACAGGCRSAGGLAGRALCEFDCENDCVCSCEGKTDVALEECKVSCSCAIDVNGNPDCSCNISECDLLTTISPNIGFMTSGYYSPQPISVIIPPPPPFSVIPWPNTLPNGFCGDGIVNGTEQCDMGAIYTSHCSDIGGGEGAVRCQPNCTLDISDCIRSAR